MLEPSGRLLESYSVPRYCIDSWPAIERGSPCKCQHLNSATEYPHYLRVNNSLISLRFSIVPTMLCNELFKLHSMIYYNQLTN